MSTNIADDNLNAYGVHDHKSIAKERYFMSAGDATIISAYGEAPEQFGELSVPDGAGPHPVLAFLHGGFWRARYDLAYARPLCATLVSHGIATWNLEYRRVGQPGGGWPGTLRDVATGIDHLRVLAQHHPLDPARVVTMGHSAGGHLALWVAARHRLPSHNPLAGDDPLPIHAAISLAGVTDLRLGAHMRLGNGAVQDFLGGEPSAVSERYDMASPRELLPLGVRQVLVHGADDDVVPSILSTSYHAAALAAGDAISLHVLAGVEHFALVEPQTAAWATVMRLTQAIMSS
jgi:acetyl esterase/lipase